MVSSHTAKMPVSATSASALQKRNNAARGQKRKKYAKRACASCKKAHTCCGDVRPCPRCVRLSKICEDEDPVTGNMIACPPPEELLEAEEHTPKQRKPKRANSAVPTAVGTDDDDVSSLIGDAANSNAQVPAVVIDKVSIEDITPKTHTVSASLHQMEHLDSPQLQMQYHMQMIQLHQQQLQKLFLRSQNIAQAPQLQEQQQPKAHPPVFHHHHPHPAQNAPMHHHMPTVSFAHILQQGQQQNTPQNNFHQQPNHFHHHTPQQQHSHFHTAPQVAQKSMASFGPHNMPQSAQQPQQQQQQQQASAQPQTQQEHSVFNPYAPQFPTEPNRTNAKESQNPGGGDGPPLAMFANVSNITIPQQQQVPFIPSHRFSPGRDESSAIDMAAVVGAATMTSPAELNPLLFGQDPFFNDWSC